MCDSISPNGRTCNLMDHADDPTFHGHVDHNGPVGAEVIEMWDDSEAMREARSYRRRTGTTIVGDLVWPTEEENAAAEAAAQASETASLDSVTRYARQTERTVRYVVTSQYRPEVRDDMYGIRDTETGEQMCSNIWDLETMCELAIKLNRVA